MTRPPDDSDPTPLQIAQMRRNARELVNFLRENDIPSATIVDDETVRAISRTWRPLLRLLELYEGGTIDSEFEGEMDGAMRWLDGFPGDRWNVLSIPRMTTPASPRYPGFVMVAAKDARWARAVSFERWREIELYDADGATQVIVMEQDFDPHPLHPIRGEARRAQG